MSATLGTELVQQVATFLSAAHQPGTAPQQHQASSQQLNGTRPSPADASLQQSQGRKASSTASVPVVVSEGRSYDVQRVYLGSAPGSKSLACVLCSKCFMPIFMLWKSRLQAIGRLL